MKITALWGRPALLVAERGAAGALVAVGALAAGTGFGACIARGRGGFVLGEGVVPEVDEVVVVVKVVESGREAPVDEVEELNWEDAEAEETDVEDASAGCWVLWARRVRVRVPASGVPARFPLRPVCVQVPAP